MSHCMSSTSSNVQPSPPPPDGIPGYWKLYNTSMQQLNDAANIGISMGMNDMSNTMGNSMKNAMGNGMKNAMGSGSSKSAGGAGGSTFSLPDGITYNTNTVGVSSPLIRQLQENAKKGILPTDAQARQAVSQQFAGMETMLLNPATPNNVKNAVQTIIGHIDVMKDFGMPALNDLSHLSNLAQQANYFLATGSQPEFQFPIYSEKNISATLADLAGGYMANVNAATLAKDATG